MKGGIFLSSIVLVEAVWVLRASYKQDRATIARLLSEVLDQDGVVVEHAAEVRAALESSAKGPADLSDYLIREIARGAAALPLLTFDADLARELDVELVPLA